MLSGLPLLLSILLAVLFVVFSSTWLKLHPFMALLLASLGLGLVIGIPLEEIATTINNGFGSIMGYIGLVVILGSIIGVILEKTGAAHRIALGILQLLGKKRPVLAMSLIGAVVGIPVFCDTGFIILSKLGHTLAKQTSATRVSLSLGLAGGLYATHTLVPPTPGPIAAAGNLGIGSELGYVILLGALVSVPVLAVVIGFSLRHSQVPIKLDDVAGEWKEEQQLPALGHSLLPILLPLLLITLGTLINMNEWEFSGKEILLLLSQPIVALLLGSLTAFSLISRWDGKTLNAYLSEGINIAGPILIITGAGGVFGSTLKASPLKEVLLGYLPEGELLGMGMLVLAFLLAAFLKSAQGSSTSALVITSTMLAPLVSAGDPIFLALMVLAIGGGAMTVSHANDSYFWVVSQFTGLSMKDAYRSFTLMTLLQGLTVLGMVLLISFFV